MYISPLSFLPASYLAKGNSSSVLRTKRTESETNLRGEEVFGDLLQDVGVGDTLTWIVETGCVHHDDIAFASGIKKGNNFDLAGLRIDSVADLDLLSSEELDELEAKEDGCQSQIPIQTIRTSISPMIFPIRCCP